MSLSRVHQLINQVRQYTENHRCASPECEHNEKTARAMGESTLSVFRSVTSLQTEDLVETLHGITLWLEGLQEYNETLEGLEGQEEEQFTLSDMESAAKSAMFVLGEELVALQDMNIIPQE